MKIFFAGGGTNEEVENLMINLKVNRLFSMLHKCKYMKRSIDSNERLYNNLMIDSGAFSWNKETMEVVKGRKSSINLPDPKEFAENYVKYMYEHKMNDDLIFVEFDVYKTLPIDYIDKMFYEVKKMNPKFLFMRVYHPSIDNSSFEIIDKWIDEGCEYIGIGNDSERLYDQIFYHYGNKLKIHGFAITKPNFMKKYDFYSVDSTSYIQMAAWGGIYVNVGNFKSIKISDLSKNKIDHFDNLSLNDKKNIEEYIYNLNCGVTLESLRNFVGGCYERMKVNVFYFINLEKEMNSISRKSNFQLNMFRNR